MSRAGRKRKAGRRYANGHLATAYVNPRTLAAEQPHRRWLPKDMRLDQRADSPLGALALIGAITDDQCLAGEEYAKAVGRYRSVLAPPAGLRCGGRAYDCNPGLCSAYPDETCECKSRTARYEDLFEALARCGRKELVAVNCVAIHGLRVQRGELRTLRAGLDALVKHLGLTSGRKSLTQRN